MNLYQSNALTKFTQSQRKPQTLIPKAALTDNCRGISREKGYVDATYLHMAAMRVTRVKQTSYNWMNIQFGHHVLDVGCGPATDTIALAELVGSTGKVV